MSMAKKHVVLTLLSLMLLTGGSLTANAQAAWENPPTPPSPHEKQIEDLKALFVFAPDIKIKTHPIRFGSGTWTAVTGVMTGTFTKPMPTPDGKSIAPTGKRFALGMVTLGH